MVRYTLFLCLWACFTTHAVSQSMNMNLLANEDVTNQTYNDVWGYADSAGNEYAIIGTLTRVYFYDVTNASNPVLVDYFSDGNPAGLTMGSTTWRDFKTYDHYAYAVSENSGEGLLIFDLQYLPDSVVWVNQTNSFFNRAHNCFIDTSSARLYVVGSSHNIVVLDLTVPDTPTQLSAIALNPGGYIHDIYVVNDTAYASHGYNGLYIWDFVGSNVNNPTLLGSFSTGGYNHSSWLTDDGNYVLYAEEVPTGKPLFIIDVSDLTNISLVESFKFPLLAPAHTNNTPHNPYIIDSIVYVSYYEDGVQLIDIGDPDSPALAAYYDTYPNNTKYNGYFGAWGVYPFLPSGNILASDISTGLYVLEPVMPFFPVELIRFDATLNGEQVHLTWEVGSEQGFSHYVVERSPEGRSFSEIAHVQGKWDATTPQRNIYSYVDLPAASGTYYYRLKMVDQDGSSTFSDVEPVVYTDAVSGSTSVYPTIFAQSPVSLSLEAVTPIGAVALYDLSGKCVVRHQWKEPLSKQQLLLDELPIGSYLLRFMGYNDHPIGEARLTCISSQ